MVRAHFFDMIYLIRRKLPSPLIDLLMVRATRSASANARKKFSPSIFLMSRSLYPRLSNS